MMRWGFLGIGRVTDRMASLMNSSSNHKLTLVAGRDEDKLQSWAEKYHPQYTTVDLAKCCHDPAVDAIYVALPPHLHAKFSIMAMEAGKVVLCEKPLALNYEESLAIQQGSVRTHLACYHATSFPFHPRSTQMRKTIRSGTLGALRRITIACSASHILSRGNDHRLSPELGGGCLLDLGWYCIYATLWFTGLRPLKIAACGSKDSSNRIWTSAQALVELEGGVIAHWDCGFDAAGRKWIEFAGSEASMICDDFLRPWDVSKPRFWIHGHDGKAACETVGVNESQESLMLDQIKTTRDHSSIESLELAVETQKILGLWEQRLIDGSNSLQ
ncbi:MAG: Gfo/Idh/MocA family protein [Pirellula sp.]|jgi:NDP-hexose-3-ketoreductase